MEKSKKREFSVEMKFVAGVALRATGFPRDRRSQKSTNQNTSTNWWHLEKERGT